MTETIFGKCLFDVYFVLHLVRVTSWRGKELLAFTAATHKGAVRQSGGGGIKLSSH